MSPGVSEPILRSPSVGRTCTRRALSSRARVDWRFVGLLLSQALHNSASVMFPPRGSIHVPRPLANRWDASWSSASRLVLKVLETSRPLGPRRYFVGSWKLVDGPRGVPGFRRRGKCLPVARGNLPSPQRRRMRPRSGWNNHRSSERDPVAFQATTKAWGTCVGGSD
jgi:hypothetical protein